MKKKLTAALLAALMLSACGSEIEDTALTVTIPEAVTTTTTVAPVPETTTVPPATTEETTTTSETTTTTEETTTTTEETTTTTTTTTSAATTTTTTAATTTTTAATTTTTKATLPPAPRTAPEAAKFMVDTGASTTTVSWDAAEGADGYVVLLRRRSDGDWEEVADTTALSVTVNEGQNRDYSYCVQSYMLRDGEKVFSEDKQISSFPYLTVKNGITYVDGLLIVNKTYALPKDYAPGLTKETQAAFNEMKAGAANDGLSIWICSGFRSYDYQYTLYWSYVNRDGSQWSADRYSARAGHSEHQSGLAVDVNQASRYFNGSPVALWLAANCWKYGFIIRYPEGKEDITGYNYESWHCRYVGKEKAKMITESGLTVEEYYGLTSVYS